MKSVIKGAGYILVHTPDMVIHNGTTQTTERIVNPESEYLKELPGHIRSFEDVLSYYPNQVYIGNVTPDELAEVPQPWCDKTCDVNELDDSRCYFLGLIEISELLQTLVRNRHDADIRVNGTERIVCALCSCFGQGIEKCTFSDVRKAHDT